MPSGSFTNDSLNGSVKSKFLDTERGWGTKTSFKLTTVLTYHYVNQSLFKRVGRGTVPTDFSRLW